MQPVNPQNYCRSCEQDFGSLSLFDRHRVGKHEYLFDEEHPDGRRCLSVGEMTKKGWGLGKRGRWIDPERVRVLRKAVSATEQGHS